MYKIYNELKEKENLENIVTNFLNFFKSNIPNKEIEIINSQFNKILKEYNIYDDYLKEIILILKDFNNSVIPRVEQHKLKLKENEEKQKCFNNAKNEIQYNILLSLLASNPKIVQYSGNCYEDLMQFLKKNKIKITPEQGKILSEKTQNKLKIRGIQNKVEKIESLESFKKECFINFIKSNETFKELLKNTEQLSTMIDNKTTEKHICNMIEQFNPYQKNTDFVATIAFLNLLQKHPKLIENKLFINPSNKIGFTDEKK